MGEKTGIAWTDHTFNPWWGCVKVSPACENCYAQTWARRSGYGNYWGAGTLRRTFGAGHWREPFKWDLAAERAGERRRVFCGSMCDVFEDHPTAIELWPDLLYTIERTPSLDWLLLTKRPHRIPPIIFPRNVWIGVTVENQATADERIPLLLKAQCQVRFLSMEPLLGPVALEDYEPELGAPYLRRDYLRIVHNPVTGIDERGRVDWVIVGGESGPNARPMHPTWAMGIRDQCLAAGVAFFFKQWGDWEPREMPWHEDDTRPLKANERWLNLAGGHGFHGEEVYRMRRVGKAKAGRLLDGREWNELPGVAG